MSPAKNTMFKHKFFSSGFALLFILISISANAQQYIRVDTSTYTPEQLVKDIFIGSQNAACITVSNVSVKGWQDYGNSTSSYGYFEKGTMNFDIAKGIILSTGNAQNAPGPNTSSVLDDQDSNWFGDQDLADALQENYYSYLNSTSLEFDFVANNTSGISFEYLFLSEEYRRTNCIYSDAFAFLIKKAGTADPYTNIAVVPGTQDPVTSLSINTAPNCPRNVGYFGSFNGVNSPTAFDGQTKVLTAKTDIIPGVKYHIKLVIADHLAGNDRTGRYDSAVFLKAGSFVGKKDLGPDLLISSSNALCAGTSKVLDATTSGATSYQWYKDGSQLAGEINPLLTIPGLITDTGTYEVEISLGGCELKGSVKVEFVEKPIITPKDFCNYDGGKPISVNLQDLNSQIIPNYKDYFKVTYFQDAAYLIPLPNNWTYSNDVKIYVQAESGSCAITNEELHLLTPKKSEVLADKTICANATTKLEAETGFKNYKWMRENGDIIAQGPTVNSIDHVSVGNYILELTSANGCKLQQEINVTAADLPQITQIDVMGSTATVFVSGGTPPYSYSLDGISFQSSNVFKNVPRGMRKVYVTDSEKCGIIEKEFLIINLINVITPNGDGVNDVLDYSDLRIKENVSMQIFDRYGNLVFSAKDKQFIWDGKFGGRALPTANYWYILNWTEPDTQLPVSYKGWILVKNRN